MSPDVSALQRRASDANVEIVGDLSGDSDRLFLAGLRRCRPQLARRRPAIERGRTRPRLAELDDALERPLMPP